MAYFGLRYPVIAKYDRSAGTYSNGFRCGKAVSLEVSPNYSEGSLYADDVQTEYEKEFTNANVTLGTSTLPLESAETIFGHTVDSTSNQITKKTTDESNYVGVGMVIDETIEGVKDYIATIITCVKFAESSDSYTTKGDSITFANPSIEGLAIGDKSDQWLIRKTFDTAAEALTFVNTTLGITT